MAVTTQNTISSLETGQYSPTAYLSGLICMALDCKWEECFYYEMSEEKLTVGGIMYDIIKNYVENGNSKTRENLKKFMNDIFPQKAEWEK